MLAQGESRASTLNEAAAFNVSLPGSWPSVTDFCQDFSYDVRCTPQNRYDKQVPRLNDCVPLVLPTLNAHMLKNIPSAGRVMVGTSRRNSNNMTYMQHGGRLRVSHWMA
jgi:hypothetical protein